MNIKKTDFVLKMTLEHNIDSTKSAPITGHTITDDNLDKFDIDEKIVKEMAKIIYLEMIKIKNSNNFNKNS